MAVLKSKLELYLQQIFRMLLDSKTEEAIAKELGVSTRTVQRYKVMLDQRYGEIWKQKTDDTLFLECSLFKNRMLTLYKILEDKAADLKVSGSETAKCCEVAANICIDLLRMESEGIRSVTEIISKNNNNSNKGQRGLNNLNRNNQSNGRDDDDSKIKEYDPNRKF
jgi:DNA invertase Pin-like site-specific DNA recombinase